MAYIKKFTHSAGPDPVSPSKGLLYFDTEAAAVADAELRTVAAFTIHTVYVDDTRLSNGRLTVPVDRKR